MRPSQPLPGRPSDHAAPHHGQVYLVYDRALMRFVPQAPSTLSVTKKRYAEAHRCEHCNRGQAFTDKNRVCRYCHRLN
jgi:ribosomal protein S14